MIQFGYHPSWSTWSAHSTSSGCSPQSATCALVMKKGRKDPKKDPKIPRQSVASLKRRKLRRHLWWFETSNFFEKKPTRKPSQQPQKTKIRSWRVQIVPRPRARPHKVRGLGATCFVGGRSSFGNLGTRKGCQFVPCLSPSQTGSLGKQELAQSDWCLCVCLYSEFNVTSFPRVLRSVVQSRHKMQTIFILCRSTKNPPFSSQIWSAETSPIRPNLNTLGNILRKMPHDAEVILGNSKGSKIEFMFIPLAKRLKKKI